MLFCVLAVIFLAAWTSFGLWMNENPVTGENVYQMGLLECMSFYMMNVIFSEHQRREIASPLALFMGAGLLYFGLTGIWYYDAAFFTNRLNYEYYTDAILFTFVFFAIFQVSYLYARRRFPNVPATKAEPRRWRGRNVLFVTAALLAIGWFARLHMIAVGAYTHTSLDSLEAAGVAVEGIGIWSFLSSMADVAGWVVWLYYLSGLEAGHDSRVWRHAALFLLALNLLYWVPTATKLLIAQSVIVPFFIWYMTYRRIPDRKYLVGASLFLGVMFPLTYVFRYAQGQILGKGAMVLGAGDAFNLITTSSQYIGEVNSIGGIGGNGRLFGRLDEFESVSGAVRVITNHIADVRFGIDYLGAGINLIPRAIWPDKPVPTYLNEFGHQIGVLYFDIGTSIAATYIGEAYLDFAIFGVFSATIFAVLYYYIYRLVFTMKVSAAGRLIYVVATPTILFLDGNFSAYISAMIQSCAMAAIVGWLMQAKFSFAPAGTGPGAAAS